MIDQRTTVFSLPKNRNKLNRDAKENNVIIETETLFSSNSLH